MQPYHRLPPLHSARAGRGAYSEQPRSLSTFPWVESGHIREVRVSGYFNQYDHPEAFDADELEAQRNQGGGGLRKQLEDALASNKELIQRLDNLEKQNKAKSTEELLREKNIDPAISAMIPDGTDPAQWIETYGKFLAPKVTEESREGTQEQGEVAPPVVEFDPALEEERQAMETLHTYGPDSGLPFTASQDQIEKLKSFETEAELLAYIRSGGKVT